jgi:type III secretion protein J
MSNRFSSCFSSLKRLLAVALLAGGLAACKNEIFSSLPERDANEMISVLSQAGISATRERSKNGSFVLSVDHGETARALALLNQRGLPRQQFESLGNIFDAKKMVSTPFEERARFMHAINQELAHSLTQISGVVSARVHVMLPDASPLDRTKQTPRASVFVYHLPDANLAQHVPVIKNLIVNSVNGLNYEDVAIAMFPSAPGGYVSTSGLGTLPGGNYLLLIVLGAILLGMMMFRQVIGRFFGSVLAKA